MSSASVPLICPYNDTLIVDMEGNLEYVNGIVKPMMVRKSITLRELVEKIHTSIRLLDMQLANSIRAFLKSPRGR